jgi:hypothetical protein
MGKNSGYIVKCSNGRIGRTYHTEKVVDGKICVHLFSEKIGATLTATTNEDIENAKSLSDTPGEKILCDISSLTTIGMAD